MRLELDEISGDHIIRVPDDIIEELNWDEGDEVLLTITNWDNEDVLIVHLK